MTPGAGAPIVEALDTGAVVLGPEPNAVLGGLGPNSCIEFADGTLASGALAAPPLVLALGLRSLSEPLAGPGPSWSEGEGGRAG